MLALTDYPIKLEKPGKTVQFLYRKALYRPLSVQRLNST